jgi:hypothetical protein
MSKLFVWDASEDATEEDIFSSFADGDSLFADKTFDGLMEMIKDDGQLPIGTVFVLEITDKGIIQTSHKFVSSKKTKETKPA